MPDNKVFPEQPAATDVNPGEPAVEFKDDAGSIEITSAAFNGTERPLTRFEKSLFALVSGYVSTGRCRSFFTS